VAELEDRVLEHIQAGRLEIQAASPGLLSAPEIKDAIRRVLATRLESWAQAAMLVG
jgi:hypothetical protein